MLLRINSSLKCHVGSCLNRRPLEVELMYRVELSCLIPSVFWCPKDILGTFDLFKAQWMNFLEVCQIVVALALTQIEEV